MIFVSATPGPYETEKSAGAVIEQIVRPTGLLDPIIEVHAKQDCLSHLIEEVRERVAAGQQVLATTITKRWAEILAASLKEAQIKCGWLHCDLTVQQRTGLLRAFRKGRFDVLVGVNLLREGLNLPGVAARGHLGRRQRRVPPFGHVADSDHRACHPKRGRHGYLVRGPDHTCDAASN